jgi:hypothetical protein
VKEWKNTKKYKNTKCIFGSNGKNTKYKITKCIFGSYENTKTNAKRQSVFFVFILYLYILYLFCIFWMFLNITKKYETK